MGEGGGGGVEIWEAAKFHLRCAGVTHIVHYKLYIIKHVSMTVE